MTHNTADCNKYEKHGSLKPNFKKSSSHPGSKLNQNFAQALKEGFTKMTKILKDKKSKTKHSHNDSDADWLIGWVSTGELELLEIKSKKQS